MSRNILIVEDHDLFRATLRRLLVSRCPEFDILEASDGLEALELCANQQPDLVVMDVNMPRLDGIRACEKMKRNSECLSVVLYSSDDRSMDDLPGCVDAFLTKQFVFERLPEKIAELLPKDSGR